MRDIQNAIPVMEMIHEGFFCKIPKTFTLESCTLKEKQCAPCHGEYSVFQRAGWIGQGREGSFLFARWTPLLLWDVQAGFSPGNRRDLTICPQRNGAIWWRTGSEGGMPGVSILLLNLEKETNPGSKRAMVLSETSHEDGVFKMYSLLSNATIFIKTLHLGPSLIRGEPAHGHRQSGP